MARIVVTEFVTLDGVFEDPGGSEGVERGVDAALGVLLAGHPGRPYPVSAPRDRGAMIPGREHGPWEHPIPHHPPEAAPWARSS